MNFAIATENNKWPCEGPKVIPISIDFSTTDPAIFDLLPQIQNNQISLVQALFVDNVDNPERLLIVCDVTGQRIVVPAYSQGYVEILSPNPPRLTVQVEAIVGTVTVKIFALNFPVLSNFWTAQP